MERKEQKPDNREMIQQNNEDEIDLLALAKTMWIGRKTIIRSVISGAILGVAIAMLSPKEYTASTIMVPQTGDNQSKMGGLGGLAALAGINMDMNTGSELSPMIYPQIVGSTPFQLELMNASLNFQGYSMPISVYDYYSKYNKPSVLSIIKKYTIGLPGVLISKVSNLFIITVEGKPKELSLPTESSNQPILLTANQKAAKGALNEIISLEVSSKQGYLTLAARMPEPLAAAQLAKQAQELLQRYIIELKIEKARFSLNFIQNRYNEVKTEFEKAQVNLALVNDRNKNFTSGLPRIETDRIQSRYTISFSVFQELAKQLEQAKIQVKKETPIFTIVEPVTVPSEKSNPNRPRIIAIWIFLGGIIGTGIVFGKGFIEPLRKKWNE